MLLDIRGIQHVSALGRFRNFARAAESLGISQPALSKSIRVIERMLGVRLFERSRTGVIPTAFGEVVLGGSGAVMESVESVLGEIRRLKGLEAGTVRVGAGPFPFALSVGTAALRVARRHPTLQLRVVQGDWEALSRDVRAGTLDVAVAEVSAAEQDRDGVLVVERIGAHGGLFYCRPGHPLLARPRVGMGDISGFPLALNALPSRVSRLLDPLGPAGRRDLASDHFLPSLTLDSVDFMKRAVRETDAISWAPELLLAEELRTGVLAALPFAPPWARLDYGCVRRSDRPLTPALEIFLAELRAVEGEIAGAPRPPPRRVRSTTRG